MTPDQCKAARILLHWDQEDLAREAGVAPGVVSAFETSVRSVRASSLRVMTLAFQAHGITFITPSEDNNVIGVQLKLS